MVLKKGMVHIYTGNGKGKTTAAVGLGIRALGAGLKVYMIQFVKGVISNEFKVLSSLNDFTFVQFGRGVFISKNSVEKIDVDIAHKGFSHAREVISSGLYDMVILDEINIAIDYGLLSLSEVLDLIKSKPEHVELVLTGRNAPSELIEHGDIVSEILDIKHPYSRGVSNRRGVDV